MASKDAYDHDFRDAYRGGYAVLVSTASTGTNIGPTGAHTIAQSTNKTYTLAAPRKGDLLDVFIDTDSTGVITVQTNSSGHTFFGSTTDSIAVSTGRDTVHLQFVATSTAVWAVSGDAPFSDGSTGALFTASASTR